MLVLIYLSFGIFLVSHTLSVSSSLFLLDLICLLRFSLFPGVIIWNTLALLPKRSITRGRCYMSTNIFIRSIGRVLQSFPVDWSTLSNNYHVHTCVHAQLRLLHKLLALVLWCVCVSLFFFFWSTKKPENLKRTIYVEIVSVVGLICSDKILWATLK